MVSLPSLLTIALTATLNFTPAKAIGTNDQTNNAAINYGTFANPSSNVRPRFRYWAPDASINITQVKADVVDAGRVGAGGVELLGYYDYGNIQLFPGNYDTAQSDWTVYGFGGAAWKTLLNAVLTSAQGAGLIVDLALGANQGAGVPAAWNNDGLLWDLQPYYASVPIGGSFSGILPGWGAGTLVSASTGLVTNIANYTSGGSNITLSQSSLTDITSSVSSTGSVSVSFASGVTGVEYRVFAYYLKRSMYPEVESTAKTGNGAPQTTITNYVQNGSWVVDHWSVAGAQATIDFWTNNLLDTTTAALIKSVGNYMWEDSQEFYLLENTFWTPNLTTAFLANRGYSVNKYVPLLYNTLTSSTAVQRYITDQADTGASQLADYRQTLTELNQIYLQTISNWAQNTLGIQFSAQVVYNLPMDMLSNIPYVNAPECENIAFLGNVDAYRQYSGPANLAGKRIVSSESGGVFGSAYQQTIPSLISEFKAGFAGGVNQYIIHGYPYTGNYPNTTWPGFTTFDYTVSEMHGRHQPGWDFYGDWLNWTARTQWVMQTGVPKVDLVFWRKGTDYRSTVTQYSGSDLVKAGYTYEYLSPDNFALANAAVSSATLAPNQQGFKALIVPSTETLTGPGVTKLAAYANAGLPIIFYGGIPTKFEGYQQSGYSTAASTLSGLTSLSNVYTTAVGASLATTLAGINITPWTAITCNGTWFTSWRQSSLTQYAYVWNSGTSFTTGTIAFGSVAVPYFYDAWTGTITPVLSFTQTYTTTTISLELNPDQTIIIAFNDELAQHFHLTTFPDSTLAISTTTTALSILRKYTTGSTVITLSNGTAMTLQPMLTPQFTLTNWALTVESWTSPTNTLDLNPNAVTTNLTAITGITTLSSWKTLSTSLSTISGRGYYSTTFTWPPTTSSSSIPYTVSGAYLDLGSIPHTARVSINGNNIGALDTARPRKDITSYLVTGSNSVSVVTSSPLGNALNAIWSTLMSSGKTAVSQTETAPTLADYGLVKSVVVVPYRADVVAF